jgi:hypothetical protein
VRLQFHPAAREEFLAAADYYDAAVPGLGDRFLVAVRRTTDLALAHPDVGARRGPARRLLLAAFPLMSCIVCAARSSKSWRLRISIVVLAIGAAGRGASVVDRTA